MYVVVETWTPKQAFLAADEETRQALFAGIQDAMKQLAAVDVVTLGWGRTDEAVQNGTEYQWFAVWQAPSKALVDGFLDGVDRSGWYTYFEQTNIVGELRSADAVMAEHLTLRVVER
ncbi:DUF6616 family protein [Streptomyces sp. NPDC048297]|uniref:DUF6616 family protein n=1 Tax=Streptomyces sp. NPDC048297 TaxID=3365531 RepID=UPI00371F2914